MSNKAYPIINQYMCVPEAILPPSLFNTGIKECISGGGGMSYSSTDWYFGNTCVPGDIFEVTLGFSARGLRNFVGEYDECFGDILSASVIFASRYPYEDTMTLPNGSKAIQVCPPTRVGETDEKTIFYKGISHDYQEITFSAVMPSRYIEPWGEDAGVNLSDYENYFDWGVSVSMFDKYSDIPELSGTGYIWFYGAILKKNGVVIDTISFPDSTNTSVITSGTQIIGSNNGKTPWTRYGLT